MNTSLTAATATIDAGRLLTLERRRHFAGLSLQFLDLETGDDRIIDCQTKPMSAGVLSERQIARALSGLDGWDINLPEDARVIGKYTGAVAKFVHEAMRDWALAAYPPMPEGAIDSLWLHGCQTRVILRHAL